SGKSSTVAKLLSSGKIYTNSGKSTLAVGMNMTNSGNALEHFIPNKSTQTTGEKMTIHGSEITTHVRHSRLMDEFVKFATKEGESLDSVHERLTTLVNIMDRNNVRLIPLVQFEPHVIASRAKKAAKNHDPLALIAHSNAFSSSHSHANSSYSPQPY
ncbi:hypothetical protein Tco_0710346, partial [Tanacetum coccineum]